MRIEELEQEVITRLDAEDSRAPDKDTDRKIARRLVRLAIMNLQPGMTPDDHTALRKKVWTQYQQEYGFAPIVIMIIGIIINIIIKLVMEWWFNREQDPAVLQAMQEQISPP